MLHERAPVNLKRVNVEEKEPIIRCDCINLQLHSERRTVLYETHLIGNLNKQHYFTTEFMVAL